MSWTEIGAALSEGIRATSWSGWLATATSVAYVILALRENILCWPFGITASAISVVFYFETQLPFEAMLNIFYCLAGIYGWWEWHKGFSQKEKSETKKELPITRLKLPTALILLVTGIAGSLVCGAISAHYKTSPLPWADTAITVFSLIATWMTAKKILENWLLWVFIDGAAVFVYFIKGPEAYLFAFLFILYTFIAIAGHFAWKKKMKADRSAA